MINIMKMNKVCKIQFFLIMACQEEPIPEEIVEEFSSSFYNIIFTPKILFLKALQEILILIGDVMIILYLD